MIEKNALEGIKVIDLTRILAGPYCTMILADFGAEVVKVEIPNSGDDTRGFGPFKNGESMYFANVNRNKKGITLNLKSKEGKMMFLDLVKEADVVVENFRPGVMDKLSLGYEDLKKVNKKIIYAAVSGFGCYGEYSNRPGYDIIAQACGGLMGITGEDGGSPLRVGNAMGDILGGLNLTIGVLLAVISRSMTGEGQRVDVSLVDSVVSSLETTTQRYFANKEIAKPMGNRYAAAYPYDSFQSKDGSFVIGCGNQKLFKNLCEKAMGMPELLEDERFETNDLRCANHKALKEKIEEWSITVTSDEAVEIISNAGVPSSVIYDLERITKDPHIAGDREMFVDCKHPIIGDMKVNGSAIKLLTTKANITEPAPLLGQHNEEVFLNWLGLDTKDVNELKENDII